MLSDQKLAYEKALREGTPLDYPWGSELTDEDRHEVQVKLGFASDPEPEPKVAPQRTSKKK
jgi:hypothetical protein